MTKKERRTIATQIAVGVAVSVAAALLIRAIAQPAPPPLLDVKVSP